MTRTKPADLATIEAMTAPGGSHAGQEHGWFFTCDIEPVSHQVEAHVLPINDLRGHTPSEDCWCKPSPDMLPEGISYIHNAADGRERAEQGARQ